MALLKKLQSATLVEAIVATVLIVVIFTIASLILNNLLLNAFSKNSHSVENRIINLQYEAIHNKIELPYNENLDSWKLSLSKEINKNDENQYWINAVAIKDNLQIKKSILCTKHE